jgi:hypothetical protein
MRARGAGGQVRLPAFVLRRHHLNGARVRVARQ